MQKQAWLKWALAGAAGLGVALLAVTLQQEPAPQPVPQRTRLEILTGATSGSNFRVGELLAGLLSHPAGISRCQTAELCGPAGLIVSTRATGGSIANVSAVQSGRADSGLAEANIVALAVNGRGPFRASGPARDLRTIARIYGEDLHLVAAHDAKILSVGDLRGKRVSLSSEGSGTELAAQAVLRAYRVAEWRLRVSRETPDAAAQLMRQGKLDAFFFIGGTPLQLVDQLLGDGVAVLIPLDGPGLERLLAAEKEFFAHTIPIGTYPRSPAVDTVAVSTLWVTRASQPEDLVYKAVRAIYHPENRPIVDNARVGIDLLDLKSATRDATAPLHAGAVRFFTEAGVLRGVPASPAPRDPQNGK